MRRVLLVAFQFPPFKASSGLERVLSLTRHLRAFDWEPIVLTARPAAYPGVSNERLGSIPPEVEVFRAPALDAARHLAVGGRYLDRLAMPDRWWTWATAAVPAGLWLIRRFRPEVLWSTYPIATAHTVGYALHRLSGLPWVADFRDPMVEFDDRGQRWFPEAPALRRMRLAIEQRAVRRASALTFCTAGARKIVTARYSELAAERATVIANGFDEDAFSGVVPAEAPPTGQAPITLVHSGTIYPTPDRDPSAFLSALSRVVSRRQAGSRPVRVILRGSGVETLYAPLLSRLQLTQVVEFAPLVDYGTALREMLSADGLLIFQGHTSNPAIPAKLYEYFRAGRPIFAMVDDAGDTAACLREEGFGRLAPLDDEDRITAALSMFLDDIEAGRAAGMSAARAARFERRHAVERFASLFAQVAARP